MPPSEPDKERSPAYSPSPRVTVREGLAYGTAGGRARVLDLYMPHDDRSWGRRSGWLFIHGGGFKGGSRRQFRRQAAHFAARLDAVAACVEYRLSTEAVFPAALRDVQRAAAWLGEHAADYGVDPGRLGACGGSAGGNLAAMLGTLGMGEPLAPDGQPPEGRTPIAAMVLCNPVVDLVAMMEEHHARPLLKAYLGGPLEALRPAYQAASPIQHVSSGAAPCLVLHGSQDRSVPVAHARRFVARLKDAGVAAELVVAEGAGHGFFNDDPWYSRTLAQMTAFAGDVLG